MEAAVTEWAVKNPRQLKQRPIIIIGSDGMMVNKTPPDNTMIPVTRTGLMPYFPDREPAIGDPITPKPYARNIYEIACNDNKQGSPCKSNGRYVHIPVTVDWN